MARRRRRVGFGRGRAPAVPRASGSSLFQISPLNVEDINEFLALQDEFASDHLELSRSIYGHVTLRDWQLNLLCPARILDETGGRARHAASMIRKEEECFRQLFILKAVLPLSSSTPVRELHVTELMAPASRRSEEQASLATSALERIDADVNSAVKADTLETGCVAGAVATSNASTTAPCAYAQSSTAVDLTDSSEALPSGTGSATPSDGAAVSTSPTGESAIHQPSQGMALACDAKQAPAHSNGPATNGVPCASGGAPTSLAALSADGGDSCKPQGESAECIVPAAVEASEGQMSGYIMFQLNEASAKAPGRKKFKGRRLSGAWAQIKQIYVKPAMRRQGCGRQLLEGMVRKCRAENCPEFRLSVLDLNDAAARWYRSLGFQVSRMYPDHVGDRDLSNVVVYVEMRRDRDVGPKIRLDKAAPSLFKFEAIDEVITIDYPDKSGVYSVKVIDFDEKRKWHKVDSDGHSLWDGESFTDTIDLNQFYRDGYVTFHRPLSLLYRELELERLALRKVRAQEDQAAKATAVRSKVLEPGMKRRRKE